MHGYFISKIRFFLPALMLGFSPFCIIAQSPQIELLAQGMPTSIRGLSVVNDNVVWVSGSNGTVGRTSNGGKTWKWMTVSGFEKTDFRDIEAFDAVTAVIMGIGEPAYVLKTINGGDTWKVVYENNSRGIFFDAMEFWNEKSGIIVGDPIDGRFFITRTFDGGDSWQDIPFDKRPVADSGEACFAASGTNVRAFDRDEAVFVSGGLSSRMFTKNKTQTLPVAQGKETTGANSIAVWNDFKRRGGTRLVVVGGDFTKDSITAGNCVYSLDGGTTWKVPKTPPGGYRSCVEFLSKKTVLTCGLNGVDYSTDSGKNWQSISQEGFHVCRMAKSGSAVYLAGSNGRVARLVWEKN